MHLLNRPAWLVKGLNEPCCMHKYLFEECKWMKLDLLVDQSKHVFKEHARWSEHEALMV